MQAMQAMTTTKQLINSRVIFVDSEINTEPDGRASIRCPSQPFSLTGSKDAMELTLVQFSMRRNWHAVNDTNRFFYTYSPGLDAYQEFAIAPGTYYTFDELAAAVQAALSAVAGYGASICVYDDPSRCLLMEIAGSAADEYICSFQVKSGLRPTGVSAAGFFSDVHELLGIIPSRTPTPVNGQGGAVGPGEQTMPFPAQLNTLEGIYVRTNLNSGNFMSFGYNRNLPDANSLVESNIMARIPLNTQAYDPTYPFVTYQDGGAEIFKLHLPRKSLDTITFLITDDKDRPLSQVSPGQAALGLLSYNMVLRWDHVRYPPDIHQYTPQIKPKYLP